MSVRGKPLSYTFFFLVVSFPFFIPVVPSSPHPPLPLSNRLSLFSCLLPDLRLGALLKRRAIKARNSFTNSQKSSSPYPLLPFLLFLLSFFLTLHLIFQTSITPRSFPLPKRITKKKLLPEHSLRSSQQINENHLSLSSQFLTPSRYIPHLFLLFFSPLTKTTKKHQPLSTTTNTLLFSHDQERGSRRRRGPCC